MLQVTAPKLCTPPTLAVPTGLAVIYIGTVPYYIVLATGQIFTVSEYNAEHNLNSNNGDCSSNLNLFGSPAISTDTENLLAATAEQPVFGKNGSNTVEYAGNKYAANALSVSVSSDLLGDGLYTLPDGRTLYVSNGSSVDISGNALNAAAMVKAISNAGYSPSTANNGTFRIDLGNNQRFAGAFALQEIGTSGTSCESVSFSAPTGNPTNSDYVFTMSCSDGLVQRITPFPDSSVFFDTVINAGFDLRTDRNTGIISIDGVGDVRPSFFITPLTLSDTAYLDANKTAEGIAVRTTDTNGDGKMDFEVISDNGVQVMYGL